MRVLAYCRVSTAEQAASGLGRDAQQERLIEEIERRGWTLTELVVDDGYSAKSLKRPGIDRALRMLKAGMVDTIMVTKLDRLSRSMFDFASMMERSRSEGWSLVALDLGVDTSTPAGEMMANVMCSFAQFERRRIGERTSEALQVLKARGKRLGGAVLLDDEIRDWISSWRDSGMTLQAIADKLTDDGIPTAKGGKRWYPSTVAAVLQSIEIDNEMDEIRSGIRERVA